MSKALICVLVFATLAVAQAPVPALPQVYIDTTWNPPAGGVVWHAHTSTDLRNDLTSANPGDTIILDAGVTYTGNFTLPAKINPNKKWIYVESANLSKLPAPGVRVAPGDAVNMPKIVTTTTTSPITISPGANHWRLVGLEVTSASTQGCNLSGTPPVNCYTYFLIYPPVTQGVASGLADSITVDRSYVHGSPTQDVREGVNANGTNFAVIDSYISDIHQSTMDSQAIVAYQTPGPIKIVDNYLSATTEDILFGGAGGYNNPYVPSDIEIRHNHLFKPLSWAAPGITLAPNPRWAVKNNLEIKSARRVLASGNIMENTWLSAQTGSSVLFTIRTSQSGNIAVVDDITFQNNLLTNVDAGFNTLEKDDQCGASYGYPNCTNPGEARRIQIYDNLVLLRPVADGAHHMGIALAANLIDVVFQHNTVLMSDGSSCFESLYFNSQQSWPWPPTLSYTHNVWVLDNALCRQPTGDWGGQGTTGLTYYMGDPAPLAPRFLGNVMFVPSGDRLQSFPVHNYATMVSLTYVSPQNTDYQLLSPQWTDTSDGKLAGINWTALQTATGMVGSAPSPLLPPSSPVGTTPSPVVAKPTTATQ